MSDFDAYPCPECGAPAWTACSPWWSCAARGAAFAVGERQANRVWWFTMGAFVALDASEDKELSAHAEARWVTFTLPRNGRAYCFRIPKDEP